MPDHLPIVPRSLVNRYIEGAQLVARSKTERLTVDMALRLNALTPTFRAERKAKGKFIAEMHFAAKESQAEKEVRSLRNLVLDEIHAALCTRRSRYQKEVAAMKHNADVIVIAIAAAVSKGIGANIVVVASLVAALLRLAMKMGVAVFCKKFKTGLL